MMEERGKVLMGMVPALKIVNTDKHAAMAIEKALRNVMTGT
jgi:hypothetical protein